jgi:proline dehydrogenase
VTLSAIGSLPGRALRTVLVWLSRRRALGRVATRLPITRAMVARFVAGESLAEALDALERLRDQGLRTTVDILGESVTSEAAARAAADQYLVTLDALAERGLDRNVSLKLSQMGLGLSEELCRENVGRVVARAVELGAFVRIDMEDHTTTDATFAIWRDLRPAPPHGEVLATGDAAGTSADLGVVIQSALRRSPVDVETLIDEGARIRLCKGAYVEPASVAFQVKADVDAAYETLMLRLLRDGRFPAFATHDERLIARATQVARADGIAPDRFEFQMLYGVRRDLQDRLARAGFGVRVYVPFGTQWYPYFMRRLAERPANVLFLLRSIVREGRRSRPPA